MLCKILDKYKRKWFLEELLKTLVFTVTPSSLSSTRHKKFP